MSSDQSLTGSFRYMASGQNSASNQYLSSDQSSTSSFRYMLSGQGSPIHRYLSSDQSSTNSFRYMSSGESSASNIIKREIYLDNTCPTPFTSLMEQSISTSIWSIGHSIALKYRRSQSLNQRSGHTPLLDINVRCQEKVV